MSAPELLSDRAEVELRLPADGAFVSVLRTLTAGLAARMDFTIDEIEDLRIAVGEASALALASADPGSDLTARFHLGRDGLTVSVRVPSTAGLLPDRESFGWQVMSTLSSHSDAHLVDDTLTITLTLSAAAGG